MLATQNPIEQEGTYPLPEAQLDRFMFELRVDYPSRSEEESVVAATTGNVAASIYPVLRADGCWHSSSSCAGAGASEHHRLCRSTGPGHAAERGGSAPNVKRYVSWGAGPRASQYLVLGAKARAAMDGRAFPDLEDVQSVALTVLRHRVVLNFQAEAEGITVDAHQTAGVIGGQAAPPSPSASGELRGTVRAAGGGERDSHLAERTVLLVDRSRRGVIQLGYHANQ